MYKVDSEHASEFIDHNEIIDTIDFARINGDNKTLIDSIINKAAQGKGLNHREAAILLECEDNEVVEQIYNIARKIKNKFYGNRIVLFAPLYLSNLCINGCTYCPYHRQNRHIPRIKLTQEQIAREVIALQNCGHKRLAIELGEDPVNNNIEYILESINTIYSIKHKNGAIRRVNINIAATTVDNYKKLKEAEIGTYILFQETYNRNDYAKYHISGPKKDYDYHTEAMDRAMEGGIEDVGLGVLFGLSDHKYDLTALIMHAEHLEAKFGVGPHTVSVPRICSSTDDISKSDFENSISDELLKKIVAIVRIALPYTGIIISTRESKESRKSLLEIGVSQISGGSNTSVGGYDNYTDNDEANDSSQFEVNDTRTLDQITGWLLDLGYIPSFCTACYRKNRRGETFFNMLKDGIIANRCLPNALVTLQEYLEDYASKDVYEKGMKVIKKESNEISDDKTKDKTLNNLTKVSKGARDLVF